MKKQAPDRLTHPVPRFIPFLCHLKQPQVTSMSAASAPPAVHPRTLVETAIATLVDWVPQTSRCILYGSAAINKICGHEILEPRDVDFYTIVDDDARARTVLVDAALGAAARLKEALPDFDDFRQQSKFLSGFYVVTLYLGKIPVCDFTQVAPTSPKASFVWRDRQRVLHPKVLQTTMMDTLLHPTSSNAMRAITDARRIKMMARYEHHGLIEPWGEGSVPWSKAASLCGLDVSLPPKDTPSLRRGNRVAAKEEYFAKEIKRLETTVASYRRSLADSNSDRDQLADALADREADMDRLKEDVSASVDGRRAAHSNLQAVCQRVENQIDTYKGFISSVDMDEELLKNITVKTQVVVRWVDGVHEQLQDVCAQVDAATHRVQAMEEVSAAYKNMPYSITKNVGHFMSLLHAVSPRCAFAAQAVVEDRVTAHTSCESIIQLVAWILETKLDLEEKAEGRDDDFIFRTLQKGADTACARSRIQQIVDICAMYNVEGGMTSTYLAMVVISTWLGGMNEAYLNVETAMGNGYGALTKIMDNVGKQMVDFRRQLGRACRSGMEVADASLAMQHGVKDMRTVAKQTGKSWDSLLKFIQRTKSKQFY